MPKTDLVIVSFLIANAFIGYYTSRTFLFQESGDDLFVKAVFYIAIIASSLLGAYLSRKIARRKLLGTWMGSGCIAAGISLLFSQFSPNMLYVMALLFGASFGIGMPSCLAYFADLTTSEKRGLASGLTFLGTNLGVVMFAFLSFDVTFLLAASLIWRVCGLCAVFFLKQNSSVTTESQNALSVGSVFRNRPFLLYVVPWLIFSLVDRFEGIYTKSFFEASFFSFNRLIEPIIGIVFVFLGGLFADRVGRKRVLMIGFVAIGLGYAALGLAPFAAISVYFYTVMDGVAWGVFMVLYMLVLWGDLAPSGRGVKEIYYTVGSIPFFLSDLVVTFFGGYVAEAPIQSAATIFSLASFFLFIAILPLIYAPETLSEKSMKDRQLKEYFKEAKKKKEKHA